VDSDRPAAGHSDAAVRSQSPRDDTGLVRETTVVTMTQLPP
jgi:hypothetical protein